MCAGKCACRGKDIASSLKLLEGFEEQIVRVASYLPAESPEMGQLQLVFHWIDREYIKLKIVE